jgi:4,5-dihydroxyphthalate decarboxylase
MLLAGQIDAAVVMAHDFKNPNIKTVIPNPAEAAAAWYKKCGAIQLNHVLVVRESLSKSHPDIVREIYRVFGESKKAAAEPPGKDGIDTRPVGFSANKKNFEGAAQFALEQGIIPRALTPDELFKDTTRLLDK